MDNYLYFNHSKNNPEKLFDPFYKKGMVVIPKNNKTENDLTENNNKMIECITTFKILTSKGYTTNDQCIIDVVNDIVNILSSTNHINFSAFSQFFMVYNSTHSYFLKLDDNDKFKFIYEMLLKYCNERHDMYLSHGYTNTILQVMCDNYSHKRNSKTSIDKILTYLEPYKLREINEIDLTDTKNYYFLPDKKGKKLFDQFIDKYNLKMQSRSTEHNKRPDIVFNCNGEFYICELKTMKGCGGGQNKQMVELINFIRYSENDSRFHYLAYLDGDYANTLLNGAKTKITKKTKNKIDEQRKDIEESLRNNTGNYFVNSAGYELLLNDIFLKSNK